jgi:type I restriction enzyme S subunit
MSSKEKTIGMKEGGKPTLVPKLRFPEFSEADSWQTKMLGDLCNIRTGKKDANEGAPDGMYPFFTCAENHIFSHSYSFDAEAILIAGNANVGQTRYYRGKFEAYQRTYVLTDFQGIDVQLLYAVLNSRLRQSLLARVQVSAMSYIKLPMLQEYAFAAPPDLTEQKKIAECLSSVDAAIAAQARKVDALKQHKKGLMQQLFPREGETQPRLRFPEFQDAREWEVKAVGDVFRTTRGQVLPMSSVKEEPSPKAPYPVYSSQTKNMGLAGYYSDYLFEDAITWTTDGANAGDVNFRSGRFYCTNVCGVLLNSQGYANACVAALLNSVTRSHVSYVGNPKLMNGVMAQIEIPFPPLAEQHRIASCLSSLEALITTEAEKLETLKTHKRGLMQQLFPSRAEDNA